MWITLASAVFALSLAVQQAAATGWTDANKYSCPSNTDNKCTEQQKGGFDWSGLSNGAFSSYGGFDFSGFKCSESSSKRDILVPRTFQDKCITGTVGTKADSSPKISCGSDQAFSITDMQVVSSIDVELDFIYSMDDGSTCKHTASCAASGSTISNTQCGGAKSVTFKLPDNSEHPDCSISIHSVGFDCGKPSSTVPPMSTPTAASVSSTVAPLSTPSAPVLSTSTASSPYGNISISAPLAGSLYSSGVLLTTSTVYITTEITKTQCASSITNCPARSTIVETSTISAYTTVCPVSPGPVSPTATPAPSTSSAVAAPSSPVSTSFTASTLSSVPASSNSSAAALSSPSVSVSSNNAAGSVPVSTSMSSPGSTQEVVTTEIVYQTTTICPITETLTSGTTQIVQTTQSVSTYFVTSTKTVCTKCVAPPATTSAVPASVSSTALYSSGFSVAPSPSSSAALPPNSSSTAPSAPVSSTAAAPSPPSNAPVTGTTQEVVTTEIIFQTVTFCPVTETVSSGTTLIVQTTQSPSTVYTTMISTICTKCVAPTPAPAPSSSSVSASSTNAPLSHTSSSAPAPSAPCPDVLPKCLKTWIPYTGCADNSDADCYCKMANFTTNVIDCVSAWGADKTEIQYALSYLVGICAAYVPQNPAVITHVPTTITLCPGGPLPTSSAAAPSVPVASSAPMVSYSASMPYASGSSSVPAYSSMSESASAPVVYSSATLSNSAPVASSYASSASSASSMTPSVPIPSSSIPSASSIMTPAPSVPAVSVSSNNAALPATSTSTPAPAPAPAALVTTISFSTTVVVPCTYSNGPSAGDTIPASSTLSTIITVVTVPQVQFTTASAVSAGASPSVGLVAGSPSPNANAVPTATGPVGVSSMNAAGAQSSTMVYSVVAGTGAGGPTGITTFTGSGSLSGGRGGVLGVMVGGLAAALMLF